MPGAPALVVTACRYDEGGVHLSARGAPSLRSGRDATLGPRYILSVCVLLFVESGGFLIRVSIRVLGCARIVRIVRVLALASRTDARIDSV